jgi:hypothetical protein
MSGQAVDRRAPGSSDQLSEGDRYAAWFTSQFLPLPEDRARTVREPAPFAYFAYFVSFSEQITLSEGRTSFDTSSLDALLVR